MQLNRCLEPDHYCSRFAVDSCPVRRVYVAMQEQMERGLSSITIASLLAPEESGAGDGGKETVVG